MTNKEMIDQTKPKRPRILRAVDIAATTVIICTGAALSLALFGFIARIAVSAWKFGYHLLPCFLCASVPLWL